MVAMAVLLGAARVAVVVARLQIRVRRYRETLSI
jgi:hypothetical protein